MSSPSGTVELAHRHLRTFTWPSVPSGTGASYDHSIVEDDLEYCNAPCRHHLRSDKYPTVGEGKHIPNLQKFAEDLTEGLKTVFPNRQAIYNRVHALLISWGPNDDLGTETEVDELSKLFEESYNFTVEKYTIPAELSEDQLEEKCMEVRRDHAGARDLLIVYYGGHGLLKGNKSIWHAWKNKPVTATTQRETSPELDWTEAHRSLMKARGDVLFILDCCYATFTTKIEPRGGTKELLAATSFKQTATGVHENSFTMAFIRELKSINKLPYTAPMIHERLLNRYTNYKIAVPQYVGLYRTVYAKSIVLAPQKIGAYSGAGDTTEGILVQQPKFMTDCRVLISIALDSPYQPPDFTEWNEWFTRAAPQNIGDVAFSIEKYIRPEGAWESTSALYLFSIPAALWNAIPSNPAYKMLAIIRSENLLKPKYTSQPVQVEIEAPAARNAVAGIVSNTPEPVHGVPKHGETIEVTSQPGFSQSSVQARSEAASLKSPDSAKAGRIYETRFYGSQVAESLPVPESNVASPFQLLFQDIFTICRYAVLLPHIFWFSIPSGSPSGPLSERYPSVDNIICSLIHFILFVLQALFFISIPVAIFLPFYAIILGLTAFWVVNQLLCYDLNGYASRLHSNPKYTRIHSEEQWIFLNGIGVGSHWLQSNLDRLALTFGRPVMGVHIKTNGIIFDIFQCLIQRCFNYPTASNRKCYAILRKLLYDPTNTRIVFILHSQGGIGGSIIIDKLHAEIREDLLAKLEVYSFGNAASHFNNPYRSLRANLDRYVGLPGDPRQNLEIDKTTMELITGKAIRHVEHYANSLDALARLGVLGSSVSNIFMGNVARKRTNFAGSIYESCGKGGQLFCHDYLDEMFPLKRCAEGEGIGGSGFEGALENQNQFMESMLFRSEEDFIAREGWEMSYFGVHGELFQTSAEEERVGTDISSNLFGSRMRRDIHERKFSQLLFGQTRDLLNGADPPGRYEFKVKDMSRLWLYVNGKRPKDRTDLNDQLAHESV